MAADSESMVVEGVEALALDPVERIVGLGGKMGREEQRSDYQLLRTSTTKSLIQEY